MLDCHWALVQHWVYQGLCILREGQEGERESAGERISLKRFLLQGFSSDGVWFAWPKGL